MREYSVEDLPPLPEIRILDQPLGTGYVKAKIHYISFPVASP